MKSKAEVSLRKTMGNSVWTANELAVKMDKPPYAVLSTLRSMYSRGDVIIMAPKVIPGPYRYKIKE